MNPPVQQLAAFIYLARTGSFSEAARLQGVSQPALSRAIQMLFGHAEYWEQLSPDDHELMHSLPSPYGPLVAWLERDHAEHGPRSWAVLSHALREDPDLGEEALAIADGDAEPNATFAEFRANVDKILDRELRQRTQALIALAATDPAALARYREVFRHWEEVKARMSALRAEE